MTKKSPKTKILGRAKSRVKVGQSRQKSDLISIILRKNHIHVPNIKSKSQKTREKSPEKYFFCKEQ